MCRERRLAGASDADEIAFGVGEVADDESARRGRGAHHAGTTGAFSLLEHRLDVRHAHVEHSVRFVGRSSSDATADARAVQPNSSPK